MRSNPERLAWRILLAAFVAFLVICGSTGYFIHWYIFRSRVPLQVDLTAARGTVSLVSPNTVEARAVSEEPFLDVEPGTEIRTETAQGILEFSDPRTGEIIGSLVLYNDSRVVLLEATAPRFKWNQTGYSIRIQDSLGQGTALVFDEAIANQTQFAIVTPHANIEVLEQGEYQFNITNDRTRISTVKGQIEVTDHLNGESLQVPTGFRTIVDRVAGDLPLFEASETLLASADFGEDFPGEWEPSEDGDPPGTTGRTSVTVFDARTAVEFDRSQANWPDVDLAHGETSLREPLNIDVTDVSSLEIEATFYIDEQALSSCGDHASECPMMIRIGYVDENGAEREYIQGFYTFRDPSQDYPLACDTCRTEHIRVNQDTWYTFQSGNLIALLSTDAKPAFLRDIRFYASGHAYKVYVSDFRLLATP